MTFGGEWLVALGNHAEAGLGLGFYSDSVDSNYRDLVHEDQTNIEQEFKLRIVPFTATFRFLPLGRDAAVQPYIGGGVGAVLVALHGDRRVRRLRRRRSFERPIIGDGGAAGPVILGGVRFRLGSWDLGGEIRYQKAEGELPPDQGFSGDKIDLGGFNYLVTVNIRF